MKHLKSLLIGLAATGSMAFTGCSTDFDAVPVNIPEATVVPNTSLLELKTTFWDDATNYIWGTPNKQDATPQTIPAREDGSHYIIAGRVISNDEQGNVFKALTIQDETCALAFSINTYNLYLDYRVGQEIVIDATGMYIGKYNGLLQMGSPGWYENGANSAWEASFMAPEFFKIHAQLNGLPEPAKIDTLQVNSFSELPSDPEGLRKWQSQLVKFNNVYFAEGGETTFSTYKSSGVSHNIIDTEGASLPVRTSGYSKFWNKTLPKGNGDVVALLGYYGSTGWQLTLIDYDGCMNFGNPTVAPGAKDNPYTVDMAIAQEVAGKSPSGWVSGYIVGTVAPEVTEINSSDDIQWTAEPDLNNTLVIAPEPDCTDVAKCLVFALPQDSKLRQFAALRENPDVYKRQMWIYGKLEPYMGTWGLTGNKGTTDQFSIDGVETGGGSIAQGDGSKEAPYNVQQVLAGTASGTAWVSGYIVGTVTDKSIQSDSEFGTANASNTNLLIAATPDETDYTKCVPLQLPTGNVRNALSLQQHPENLGKQVSVYGSLENYFGVPGVKAITEFSLDGAGDTPVTPPVTGSGDGSKENPYDVAQVLGGTLSGQAWVKGYIVGTVTDKSIQTDSEFGTANASNTNLLIAATPTETDYTKCVPLQLPIGDVRNALSLQQHPDNLGKQVSVYGSLENYFGVPGVKTITEFSLDGAGDTPVTPPVSDTIYTALGEADANGADGWTFDNVSIGTLDYVWSWKEYNSKYYLNGSGYLQGAVAAEAYAISPVIDLAGTTNPSLSFDHAAKFQTTLRDLCGVYARVEGAADWTKLTIPEWPVAGAWTFANSGNVDLTAFAGKKIQIAFKYGSTTAGADTWEIKNLKVTGDGGNGGSQGGDDPNPPTPPTPGEGTTILATAITNVPGTTTIDGYTITIDKASGATAPAYNAASSAVRLYADNTMEISGGTMTSITFTLSSDAKARYTTMACSTGEISPAQTADDTSFTWVGNASSVTFTVGHDATLGTDGASKRGQIRFTSLEIATAQ